MGSNEKSKHTLTKRGEYFIAAATPAILGMAANAPYSIPVSNDEVATSSVLAWGVWVGMLLITYCYMVGVIDC